MPIVPIRHFHMFCGLGGGAAGFNRGSARVGNLTAKMQCIGGIDNDPVALANFEMFTKTPGTLIDLFSREQYRNYHGVEPPEGWREATPTDIQRAAGFRHPHIIFLSAPCQGLSGLLAESHAKSRKYQALNELAVRGIMLMIEAWKDDPVELIIFENVPRIQSRGRHLLDQIQTILRAAGYAVAETRHNCGELGGLAQNRNRFLMVARHVEKVPPFLYEPPKQRLRGVGEVLSRLPLAGDTSAGGPMHRIPELAWQTWVRLAFVEPGKDWRSLQRLRVGPDGNLIDWALIPNYRGDYLGVCPWEKPTGVITGRGGPTNGKFSIADPRHSGMPKHNNEFRIIPWGEPAQCVSSAHGSGQCVADPRIEGHQKSVQMGVRPWTKPAATVTGNMAAGAGPTSIADPRPRYNGDYVQVKYRVTRKDEPAGTVIATSGTGNGAFALSEKVTESDAIPVENPKPACLYNNERDSYASQGHYGVCDWQEPSNAITGYAKYDRGKFAVADPRSLPKPADKLICRIITPEGNWHRPMTTLELAALQSLIDPDDIQTLHAMNDTQRRKQIGNAVPPDAAAAIASVFAQTLLLAWSGESFMLSSQPIWVKPIAVALAVDIPDFEQMMS